MSNPELFYQWLLERVAVPAVSNRTTYGRDLKQFARRAFGTRFRGVFMRDEIPSNFNAQHPYGIVNLDRSVEPGSHWIAVAYQGPRNLMIYDSFGKMHRPPREIFQKYPNSELTDPDAEQSLRETNCGARCLAWLMLVEIQGFKAAKRI